VYSTAAFILLSIMVSDLFAIPVGMFIKYRPSMIDNVKTKIPPTVVHSVLMNGLSVKKLYLFQ